MSQLMAARNGGIMNGMENRNFMNPFIGMSLRPSSQAKKTPTRVANSVANMAIIPMQDYLCKGAEARINTPSTLGDNWKWRMKRGVFTEELVGKIRELTRLYGRLGK